jgi:hypothetical protein
MSATTALAPSNLGELMTFSDRIAKSEMIPPAYRNKPNDVMVAVQMGYELGLAPLQALQNIACINGKPSIYGDAALAIVKGAHVCEDIIEKEIGTQAAGDAWGFECFAKRRGKAMVQVRFTVGDAKKAGLWGKQGPWTTYPKRMLQMRARGFALRDAFPDILKGIITAEEAADILEKDITPPSAGRGQAPQSATPSQPATAPTPRPATNTIDNETGEVLPPQSSAPQPPTQPAEPSASTSNESDPNAWPLFVPGQEAPFAVCHDRDAWLAKYGELEDKVCAGKKALPATKQQKLRDLQAANKEHLRARCADDDAFFTGFLKTRADIIASLDA